MSPRYRWDPCVMHRQGKATEFVKDYFASTDRRVLLVAGAGFDPRTLVVPELLGSVLGDRVQLLLLREQRRAPPPTLLERAERHIRKLQEVIPNSQLCHIRVFADDSAVVIGQSVAEAINGASLDGLTDIVVDWSALSIGGAFTLVRSLLEKCHGVIGAPSIHVMVVESSRVDHAITRLPGGSPTVARGYEAGLALSSNREAARLWVPQLCPDVSPQLDSVHRYLGSIERAPHDVMPILPFPARDPRLPDRLLEEFSDVLKAWGVDQPSLAYASEDDPLDLYRILVSLYDLRDSVFGPTRRSQVILSPLGSKLLAIGAMMAAIDRPMPVVYVEAPDFDADVDSLISSYYSSNDVIHLWLSGEAYLPLTDKVEGSARS